MPPRRRSPLFSAVVVAGVSLTQTILACGETTGDSKEDSGGTGGADTSSEDGSTDGRSPSPDANPIHDSGSSKDAETCPDGSDRPTPPCHLIK